MLSRFLQKSLDLGFIFWLCLIFAAGSVVFAFFGAEISGALMGSKPHQTHELLLTIGKTAHNIRPLVRVICPASQILTLVLAIGITVSGIRAIFRKRFDSVLIHLGCACVMFGWLMGQYAIRTTTLERPVTGSMAMLDGDRMDVLWTGPNYRVPMQRLFALVAMRDTLDHNATEWLARIDDDMHAFLQEGQDYTAKLPFSVYLEKFTVERYEDGPSSRLTIFEAGKKPRAEHVKTNSPVRVQGHQIHQMSWGEGYDNAGNPVVYTVLRVTRDPATPGERPTTGGFIAMIEGERADALTDATFTNYIASLPFTVRLDRFNVEAPVREYRSRITILEQGKEPRVEDVRVNHPVRVHGYHIYQMSWEPSVDIYGRPALYTVLQLIRDPGLPVVYTGFVILTIGIFWFMVRVFARSGGASWN